MSELSENGSGVGHDAAEGQAAEGQAAEGQAAEGQAGVGEAGVGEAIERAVSAITRWASRPEVRRRLRAEGSEALSATDTWLLQHLVDGGPVRMRQLAEWQTVDKSTMTAQINRLESRGLVSREIDPSDGRAVLVRPSPAAREIIAENSETARLLLDRLVCTWSAEERTSLSRLLARFTAEIEHGGPDRHPDGA